MKFKILIPLLLIAFTVNSQVGFSDCSGEAAIYYAKNKIYIYQSMDSESAIKGEISKGERVYVVNSFFGKMTGFWEICFKGNLGYVKKSQLSYEKVSSLPARKQATSIINTESNQNVGFDPFLGLTTSSVNFRNGPSVNNNKLSTLSLGTTIYVYSNKTVNGYYKAIDIRTTQIGWVHENYVKYLEDVDVRESGSFQSTGYLSSYNPEISITNKSSYTIKLIVGDTTIKLNPFSSKTVNIKPGKKNYIATAPNVLPSSGYQYFQSNNGYQWEFWVE